MSSLIDSAKAFHEQSQADALERTLFLQFTATAAIVALHLALKNESDAEELKEYLVKGWRAAAEEQFERELTELTTNSPSSEYVKELLGNADELRAKHKAALDRVEPKVRGGLEG